MAESEQRQPPPGTTPLAKHVVDAAQQRANDEKAARERAANAEQSK